MTSLLFDAKEEIDEVVLVPPLFERDHKGRSRLAKSSYDFLFCKPNLRWLFNDYLPIGAAKSILYFSPPEDPRISVTARLKASVKSGSKYVQLGDSKYGTVAPYKLAALHHFQWSAISAFAAMDVSQSCLVLILRLATSCRVGQSAISGDASQPIQFLRCQSLHTGWYAVVFSDNCSHPPSLSPAPSNLQLAPLPCQVLQLASAVSSASLPCL